MSARCVYIMLLKSVHRDILYDLKQPLMVLLKQSNTMLIIELLLTVTVFYSDAFDREIHMYSNYQ